MAIQSQPTRIPEPFAASGTKNGIPATNSNPSASQAASWASGFPPECSQPISAGGCPVPRNDFNGILNHLSQDYSFRQDGGVWEWSSVADYAANRVVLGSNGLLYWSVAQSGPSFGGAHDPTTDISHTYWVSPKVPMMPADDSSYAAANTSWVGSKINNWYSQNSYRTYYYLDPAGDDSNDGLTPSTPKKTWAAMLAYLDQLKIIGTTEPRVNIAAGVYNEPLLVDRSGFKVAFYGPTSGYAQFTQLSSSADNVSIALRNRFRFIGNGVACVGISVGSTLNLSDATIDIQTATQNNYCFLISSNSVVVNNTQSTITITYSGSNSFTYNFYLRQGARFVANGTINISVDSGGSVSGQRYNVIQCSGISGFGSTTLIPGTINGYVDSTSYYS